MRRLGGVGLYSAVLVLLLPEFAYAQASLTGVVRDSSGAVLPGVTIEAASAALIEKVRSAVTDGTGQYRIENLRPGTYEITFTLTGFRTVKREGVELVGSLIVTVDAEMQVGSLDETVTVTGESPIVDVQSAKRQQVISNDLITAVATGRSYNALMVLIPGVQVTSADIATCPCGACTFGVHGRNNEGRVQVDGLAQGASVAGTTSGIITDPGNSQEVTVTITGGLGEAETSGPIMNFVPKTGGNVLHGSFFASGTNHAMQGDNFTAALKAAGLVAPSALQKAWDVNGSVGGPIKKDELWYFVTGRTQGAIRTVTNMYYNLNAGNRAAYTYVPDLGRQA